MRERALVPEPVPPFGVLERAVSQGSSVQGGKMVRYLESQYGRVLCPERLGV